jgi:hypothetical protein
MPSRNPGEHMFTNPRQAAQSTRELLRKAHEDRTATAEPSSRSQELDFAHGPVNPSIFPTASSNPQDPRTAKAGYQPASMRMRVWWGDGRVAYDYFDITPQEWHTFAQQAAMPGGSPGKWINAIGNSHSYGPISS